MSLNPLLFWSFLGILTASPVAGQDVLAYVGGAGQEQLRCVVRLSDGTVLIGGGADRLDWIPKGVPQTMLSSPEIVGTASGKTAFLLHVSGDLQQLLHVVTLPVGAAHDVHVIQTTNVPGAATGDLFISGRRGNEKDGGQEKSLKPGYFLAKLDGNFVSKVPTRCVWLNNVWAEGSLAENSPWDVGSDGKVLFAEGTPHGYDWVSIKRLKPDGTLDVVEDWRLHWCEVDGQRKEWSGSPASQCPLGQVVESGIVLKVWGRGDFRSWTQADYTAQIPDGNGGVKQGRWPYDVFFEGPFNPTDPNRSPRGRGYTGYGWPSTPCGNVGAIVIDRRDNHVYIGGNNKSALPHGPDFEPYVIAMTDSGRQKWWMRLYREVPPAAGQSKTDDQDGRLSTPDQYVDALAIDYSTAANAEGALVVLARCHGNNVINFWKGNEIKHPQNPGDSFQSHFTGSNGNIHYGWLGRMTLSAGAMLHATYIGEYAEGAKVGNVSWTDPNLDGWPKFTSAWPDINTTRCRSKLQIDGEGSVYVVGTGRRPVTTRNAIQKMPQPSQGESRWCDFVRVYNRELTTLRYSSIIAGQWDWKTKSGGSEVSLQAVCPTRDGLLVVGHSVPDAKTGEIGSTEMPVKNAPAWSLPQRQNADGVIGLLGF